MSKHGSLITLGNAFRAGQGALPKPSTEHSRSWHSRRRPYQNSKFPKVWESRIWMYLEQFPPANHGPSSQTQSRTAKNWWPEDTSTHDIRVSNLQNSGEKQTWFRVKPLVPKNNWLTNDIEWLFPKYGEIGLTHSQILTSYLLDCKNFAQRAFRVGSCFRLPWNVMGWSNRQTKMKPPVRVMNYPEQRLMCWILWTCFHQKCVFFQ